MNSKKSIRVIVAMASLMAGPVMTFAHDGVEHVMGTVKSMTATSITVETVKHETSVVALDPATKFSNKGVKALAKDLKIGDRVAIDTKDDAGDKPHAISVKWGATSTSKSKMPFSADHKIDPKMKR
jgi:hypothetical protein